MEQIIKRLANLLAVKSIVTIVLTAVFAFLSTKGQVSTDQFLTVFTVVIAFYFGTQAERKSIESSEIVNGLAAIPESNKESTAKTETESNTNA